MRAILLVIALMSTTAHAETASQPMKIGVGASFFRPWNLGASVFVGLTDHQALHVRAARYLPIRGPAAEYDLDGRIYEVGVSWAAFSNHLLDGMSIELGAFARNSNFGLDLDTGDTDDNTRRRTESFGAHALVGFNFMIEDRVFLVFAIGASKWIEKGTDDRGEMTKPILDTPLQFDGYFRIGFTFDVQRCR